MSGLAVQLKDTLGKLVPVVLFSTPASGVIALFWRFGSGKTIVLRAMAGLFKTQHGKVRINGESGQDSGLFKTTYKHPIGYGFQEASLLPHFSVRRNLEYG